ncbi:MAG: PilZ domain-containing protein [Candidatus Omnitrophica bacterium]|nr:PilZ domain-containing protein [Candidatus Omnitrophota bacterium]
MGLSTPEKRNFLRHPVHVPIVIRPVRQSVEVPSKSVNISQGGLSFLWEKKLLKRSVVQITIPVKDKLFTVKGKVVYSEKDATSPRFRTGVSFTDRDSAFQAKLAEETLEILEYQKKISETLGHIISEEEAADEWIQKYAKFFPSIASV